ncbi:AMP-binding protein [Paenalcaligenes suwonensis]|uniref:AMP-binding protein n=1 Tax=Paenalcaligenes suwonensis TaxID=1202713 RepID=UPI00140ADD3E|nr:AMP-binding protein [Paenalcaligenes suwonensis]NHC60437.1 ATP-dependent acyl-CoA ligase [Paenalcaligenes suwonensis]
MNGFEQYFEKRIENDQWDVAPLLYRGLSQTAEQDVIEFESVPLSRKVLAQQVAGFQQWLVERGITKGDSVAVMLSNTAEHIALLYALMLSGVVWIPVNTKVKGPGVRYIVEHATPSLVIAEPEFADVLADAGVLAGQWVELQSMVLAHDAVLRHPTITPSDTLCIIYTSGTTGAPKGVVFTHRMMRVASEAAIQVAGVKAGSRLFLWEPLCHIGGAQMLLVPFLENVCLLIVKRFSASRFWSQWQAARATHLHYLGGILDILVRLPQDEVPEGASIQTAWGAGVSKNAWVATQEQLGCELRECYGMTECSSFATFNASGKPGSIGKALPWIQVELLDEEGHAVATGEIGQMVLSSPLDGVFLPEYLHNADATQKTVQQGKLYTGDAAWQDSDGDLFFVGRKTDSMRVRGENVSAWEIERIFAEHDAVEASAAVGVASDIGEQEIMLFVKFRPDSELEWSELIQWASKKLASYQVPRFYRAVERFELTPSERIKKHCLDKNSALAWDRLAVVA